MASTPYHIEAVRMYCKTGPARARIVSHFRESYGMNEVRAMAMTDHAHAPRMHPEWVLGRPFLTFFATRRAIAATLSITLLCAADGLIDFTTGTGDTPIYSLRSLTQPLRRPKESTLHFTPPILILRILSICGRATEIFTDTEDAQFAHGNHFQ